jgi:glutamate dehydrogenase/leucine dehydrogenase
MAQNSARLSWTREEVDDRLHKISDRDPPELLRRPKYGTPGNRERANIGGFLKAANAASIRNGRSQSGHLLQAGVTIPPRLFLYGDNGRWMRPCP